MVATVLISESSAKRLVINGEHDHHQYLTEEGVGNARDTHELDHAVPRSVVHVCASKDSTQEPDDVCGADGVEPRSFVGNPLGVAAIRDGPAIGMQ